MTFYTDPVSLEFVLNLSLAYGTPADEVQQRAIGKFVLAAKRLWRAQRHGAWTKFTQAAIDEACLLLTVLSGCRVCDCLFTLLRVNIQMALDQDSFDK
jgi:hypothetical protein